MDASGTSRAKKTAFYARKEDLPPEMRAKFEEWQSRDSQRHPLYERESLSYGKVPRGMEAVYKPPEFRKAGNLCVYRCVLVVCWPPKTAGSSLLPACRRVPAAQNRWPPPHPPAPNTHPAPSSKHFLKVSGDRRTTLDTSITKKSFRD